MHLCSRVRNGIKESVSICHRLRLRPIFRPVVICIFAQSSVTIACPLWMLFTTLSTAWKLNANCVAPPVGVSWKEEKHRHWKTACREDLRSCFPPSYASCPAHSRQPKPGSGLDRRHGLFVSAFQAARRGQQESRLRRKVLAHQEETWRRRQRTYSPSSVLSSRTPSETRRGGTRLTRLLSGLRCQTTSSFKPD
jgi:hypothetical protein